MTALQAITTRSITVKRPSNRSAFRQSCIIVRDASGSMSGQKEFDALDASRSLVDALAGPRNADTFRCAVIDFSSDATIVHPPCPAGDLAGRIARINVSGFTNIAAGLREAGSVLQSDCEFLPPGVRQLNPVIALYSDGEQTESDSPQYEAERLKQSLGCTIVTVAFGADADENLLRKLASSPRHCYRAARGADLRNLFANVGRTMSLSATAGQDARQALGHLQ